MLLLDRLKGYINSSPTNEATEVTYEELRLKTATLPQDQVFILTCWVTINGETLTFSYPVSATGLNGLACNHLKRLEHEAL